MNESNSGLMSEKQFTEAIRHTPRLSQVSAAAARSVLCLGLSQSKAAKLYDIKHRQQVSRAVGCVKKAATRGAFCAVCGSKVQQRK